MDNIFPYYENYPMHVGVKGCALGWLIMIHAATLHNISGRSVIMKPEA